MPDDRHPTANRFSTFMIFTFVLLVTLGVIFGYYAYFATVSGLPPDTRSFDF